MRRIILSFITVIALAAGLVSVTQFAAPQSAAAASCGAVAPGVLTVCTPLQGAEVPIGSSGGSSGGSTGVGSGGPRGGGPAPVITSRWVYQPCNSWYYGRASTTSAYPIGTYSGKIGTCLVKSYSKSSFISFPRNTVVTSETLTCAPVDGKAPVGLSRFYQQATGTTDIGTKYAPKIVTTKDEVGGRYYCLYPSVPPTPVALSSVTCIWNLGGNDYYSSDRASIASNGSLITNRGALRGDPVQPSVSGSTVTNCYSPDGALLQWSGPVQSFGYYRLSVSYSYQKVTTYGYPAWTNNKTTFVKAGSVATGSSTNYYTYSCPTVIEGPVGFNQLPAQGTRIFSPALCPSTHWVCSINGTLDINGSHANQQLMRDGANIKVTYPSTTVIGTGFRNVTATDYKTDVLAGSTPYNSSDGVNGAKQYFKLKTSNGTTQENFGTWYSNANANRAKFLSWYWASDVGGSFSITDTVRFTAEFQVPVVTNVGGPTTIGWKTDTVQCPNTPVVSNRIQLLRSVNDY